MEINTREVIGFLYGLKRELCDGCTPEQGRLIQDTMKYAIDCIIKYQQMQSNYENRLKADMVAMLTEIQLEIEELDTPNNSDAYMTCSDIIQQKINSLQVNNSKVKEQDDAEL